MQILTKCLLSKYSFEDEMSDFYEKEGYPNFPENSLAAKDPFFDKKVLVSLLKKYVVPKISQEITLLETLHRSPLRITNVNGVRVDNCADYHDEFKLLPEFVEIYTSDVIKEIFIIANDYDDLEIPTILVKES